jgi:hypothetical protein
MTKKSICRFLNSALQEILGGLLYTYLHPPLGADYVSGQSWHLMTGICDEGDSLTLCA